MASLTAQYLGVTKQAVPSLPIGFLHSKRNTTVEIMRMGIGAVIGIRVIKR